MNSSASETITTGEVGRMLGQPGWRIRSIVDQLGLSTHRLGLYRAIRRDQIGAVAAELERRGWFKQETNVEVAG